MAFINLLCTAIKLKRLKNVLLEEKYDSLKISRKEKPKRRWRHLSVDARLMVSKIYRKMTDCFCLHRFCFRLRHYGSVENFILKSLLGFLAGILLTYIFFIFSVFQLNLQFSTATLFCSILGCILTIGLAFSEKIRCIVLLTLPQFFSEKGRQALLAYAFILAITGPAKNTLNNMGILSESLACGQEQLKSAVKQIIDVIKKPFYAIKDAIKKVIKTVKEIVKKIKELLLKIKRIIMAIVRVIKAAFEFLAKIMNLCNKELGTPFERCSRVFENAVADCSAKLGPLFSWVCSITYVVKSVCYLVKIFDVVCAVVEFLSDSVVGVVIRKVKIFVRHIKTMFYVRIRFSHSFKYQMESSKSIAEIAKDIVSEIKDRSQNLVAFFKFLTSAATLFFLFIVFKVSYYRYRYLTSDNFDNIYINEDFHKIDMRRVKMGKETVLPLNNREAQKYIRLSSRNLVKTERKALSKSITTLATATLKLAIYMASDYSLYWILDLIKYYGRFQSKVPTPNIPSAHISGKGLIARLLRSIVCAFQPVGVNLEIDTVPCLPTPIPPNYDRYAQIATLVLLCWVLTILQPYGLRFRSYIMGYYYPTRAKQRSIWLYNHIMRSRSSFLKFARRQLRRMFMGDKSIEKVTCKEYLAANSKILALCLRQRQLSCLVCGTVFRDSESKKPIKCHTPGCPGIYCEECFADLQNLCTVCLSPIEYGDLSDIDEEKDSSEDEVQSTENKRKRKSWCKRRNRNEASCLVWWCCSNCCKTTEGDAMLDESTDESEPNYKKGKKVKKCKICKCFKKDELNSDDDRDDQASLVNIQASETEDEEKHKADSDYYSSDVSTDYSYTYQYDKCDQTCPPCSIHFKDVEKQEIPDYATMESFAEVPCYECRDNKIPECRTVETKISGTTFDQTRMERHVDFIGVQKLRNSGKSNRQPESVPLLEPSMCLCSDDEDYDYDLPNNDGTIITLPNKSTMSTFTKPGDTEESFSFSSLDSEIMNFDRRHKYPQQHMPKMDLTGINRQYYDPDHPKSRRFSDCVTYREESETPPSTPSSRNWEFSTNISSQTDDLEDCGAYSACLLGNKSSNIKHRKNKDRNRFPDPDETTQSDNTYSKVEQKSRHGYLSTRKHQNTRHNRIQTDDTRSSRRPGDFPINLDDEGVQIRQRRKVQNYYKSLKEQAMEKIQPTKRPSRLRTLVQKIIRKRKNNQDELPLYNQPKRAQRDNLDIPLPPRRPPTYLESQFLGNLDNSSSEEEGGKQRRIRGGGIEHKSSLHRPLIEYKRQNRTSRNWDFLKEDTCSPNTNTSAISVLSKYYISIEDLTPTRDSALPMTTVGSIDNNCYERRRISKETPVKDIPEQPEEDSIYGSTRCNSFEDNARRASSSVLSEEFCCRVLGKPCGATVKRYAIEHSEYCQGVPESSNSETTIFEAENLRGGGSILSKVSCRKKDDPEPEAEPELDSTTDSKSVATKNSVTSTSSSKREGPVGVSLIPNKSTTSDVPGSVHRSSLPKASSLLVSTPYTTNNTQIVSTSGTQSEGKSFDWSNNREEDQGSFQGEIDFHQSSKVSELDSTRHSRSQDQGRTSTLQSEENISDNSNHLKQLKGCKDSDQTLVNTPEQRQSRQLESYPSTYISSRTYREPVYTTGESTINTIEPNYHSIQSNYNFEDPRYAPGNFSSNPEDSRYNSSNPSRRRCICRNQTQQTSPTPILKPQRFLPPNNSMDTLESQDDDSFQDFYPARELEPSSLVRGNCVCGGRPVDQIDRYPAKENAQYRVPAERQKFVLTSDKIQQTSEDNLSRNTTSGYAPSSRLHSNKTDVSVNTLETSLIKMDGTIYSSPETTPSYQWTPCQCPTYDPQYRGQIPISNSEQLQRELTPRREDAPIRRRVRPSPRSALEYSSAEEYQRYVPHEYQEIPIPSPAVARRQNTIEQKRPPCTGECIRNQKTMKSYPRPKPPPYVFYPTQYEEGSSAEESPEERDEEEFLQSYGEEIPNDLAYQNNDEYMELLQELEETLQTRNRNRVKRAMREFEHRSRYNKPLEKPIINYDETSESEEPIIRKIGQLSGSKGTASSRTCRCRGGRCTCGAQQRKMERDEQVSRSSRVLPPQTGSSSLGSTTEKTRWYLDANGEWFRRSDSAMPTPKSRRHPPKSPSPHKDGPCKYECSCCATR